MVLLPSVPVDYEWVQQDWTGTVPEDTFFIQDGDVMWVLVHTDRPVPSNIRSPDGTVPED